MKRENQDEFFIQVEDFGGADDANLFCVFDGHGTYGKDAAAYSRQQLPVLLDAEMRKYFNVSGAAGDYALVACLLMQSRHCAKPVLTALHCRVHGEC